MKKDKSMEISLNINAQKLSSVLKFAIHRVKQFCDDLDKMNEKGCPYCGSCDPMDKRLNEALSEDQEHDLVKCLNCGSEYVLTNGKVDILHRKP